MKSIFSVFCENWWCLDPQKTTQNDKKTPTRLVPFRWPSWRRPSTSPFTSRRRVTSSPGCSRWTSGIFPTEKFPRRPSPFRKEHQQAFPLSGEDVKVVSFLLFSWRQKKQEQKSWLNFKPKFPKLEWGWPVDRYYWVLPIPLRTAGLNLQLRLHCIQSSKIRLFGMFQ